MSNRARLDRQPTAHELKARAEACQGFKASDDPEICALCGGHAGHHAEDDGIDKLAEILPPDSRVVAPGAEATVEERQADAVADAAPVGAPVGEGDNSKSRYEIIKEKFDRLAEIKIEQKALRDEASEIVDDLDKQQGVNRGGLSEIRKLFGLDAATIKRRETSRAELFDLLIKPKLDEAEAGQADE